MTLKASLASLLIAILQKYKQWNDNFIEQNKDLGSYITIQQENQEFKW